MSTTGPWAFTVLWLSGPQRQGLAHHHHGPLLQLVLSRALAKVQLCWPPPQGRMVPK